MSALSHFFARAAMVYFSHPQEQVRFLEITPDMPNDIISQLAGKDAVHNIGSQTVDELRHYRLGGSQADKRCFAMMNEDGVLHSAIYVHVGNNPIESYSDLAGDVMPILTSTPSAFQGNVESFHCYSISGQLSGVKGMGPVLVRNLHNFLVTNYPNAVISTLSPMRDFDKHMDIKSTQAWAREHDIFRRHAILNYLTKCVDGVQKFHMGNGAIVGAIRLSTPDGAGDSLGLNRCMVNYIYDRDVAVLDCNSGLFKKGVPLIECGLVDRSLISQSWGMVEGHIPGRPSPRPVL